MDDELVTRYREALLDTNRFQAIALVHDAVRRGSSPEEIVFSLVLPTMDWLFQGIVSGTEELNLAQHVVAAQIASEVTDEMVPLFAKTPAPSGTIVIGTAFGDFHSLGKKIIVGCLKARMFTVVDLGVNVSAERFVDAAVQNGAAVIGISAMMVHTAKGENGCKGVRAILQQRNLADSIRIIVGGAPFVFNPGLAEAIGADAWAPDGLSASKAVQDLIQAVPA